MLRQRCPIRENHQIVTAWLRIGDRYVLEDDAARPQGIRFFDHGISLIGPNNLSIVVEQLQTDRVTPTETVQVCVNA